MLTCFNGNVVGVISGRDYKQTKSAFLKIQKALFVWDK